MIQGMLEKSRLLRPMLFLNIKSDKLSRYRWAYPLWWLLSVGACVGFFFQGDVECICYELIEGSANVLTVLPGFYIAALAAIATFNAPTMDMPLQGEQKATLTSRENETAERILTRRRFLCLLFGYLSFLSLSLYLANMTLMAVVPEMKPHITIFEVCIYYKILLAVFYGFFFLQLISLTLLSLFYLCDRIHWTETDYYE